MKLLGCCGNDGHDSGPGHLSDRVLGEPRPSHEDTQSLEMSPCWEVLRLPANSQHHSASSTAGPPWEKGLMPSDVTAVLRDPYQHHSQYILSLSKDPPWRMFCCQSHLKFYFVKLRIASKELSSTSLYHFSQDRNKVQYLENRGSALCIQNDKPASLVRVLL